MIIEWRKASRSGNQGDKNCVEVSNAFSVRDSKNPQGPVLELGPAKLAGLFEAIRRGDHDL